MLFVFGLVVFLIYGRDTFMQKNYEEAILVGNNTIWVYQDKRWLYVTDNKKIEKLDWQKYNIYLDNKEFGNYYLWHDENGWYAFDDNKKAITMEGKFLAYLANHKIDVYDFSEKDVKRDDFIKEVLEDNGLSSDSEFSTSSQVSLDFDNDGKEEDFYLISNVFPIGFSPDTIFSFVFMVKDDTIYYIYKDVSEARAFNGCKPYFNTFLDVNNDKSYELVLSCGRYSVKEEINMLYQYKDNTFKILISNQ